MATLAISEYLPLCHVVYSDLTYGDIIPAQSQTSQNQPISEVISRIRRSDQLPTMWLGQVYSRKSKTNYTSAQAIMSKARGYL